MTNPLARLRTELAHAAALRARQDAPAETYETDKGSPTTADYQRLAEAASAIIAPATCELCDTAGRCTFACYEACLSGFHP